MSQPTQVDSDARPHKKRKSAHLPPSWVRRKYRREVGERDGWICQICGEPVNRSAKPQTALYPTLDHIVPFQEGGNYVPQNLRLAHYKCNFQRHHQ